MKKRIFFVFLLIFLSFSAQAFALGTSSQSAYTKFQTTIESRYTPEKNSQILLSVQKRLLDLSYESSSTERQKAIQDIMSLNNEELYKKWLAKELDATSQKQLEAVTQEKLKRALENISLSWELTEVLDGTTRSFVPTNTEGELLKDGDIVKVSYERFFPVLPSTIDGLKKKQGIIILSSEGDYRFLENYSYEKKIPYSELQTFFAGFFTSNHKVIEKGWYYYGYLFQNYKFYEDTYGAYQSQLDVSGFKKDSTFLYKTPEGKYNFVTSYTERKLASITQMFGVSQKELFLKYMLSDGKHLASDISKNMQAIASMTLALPKTKTQQETIAQIYAWILENIEYSTIENLEDTEMFSAGEAFQRKDGVCTAYSKLMVYMMLYKNIYDVEMIEGHVIDAQDFPKVGHAWVRHVQEYYDPTFDDPIGATTTKTPEEYRYYKLPQDIFYANRFLYDALPEMFKTASKQQISQYIFNGLSNLLNSYGERAYDYLVFAPVTFRNTYNISANTTLTPEILAQKIGNYTVEDNSFRFQKDGKTLNISWLRYYILTSETTQSSLDALNYDIADMTLFDWELSDGTREWRLAYELTTR